MTISIRLYFNCSQLHFHPETEGMVLTKILYFPWLSIPGQNLEPLHLNRPRAHPFGVAHDLIPCCHKLRIFAHPALPFRKPWVLSGQNTSTSPRRSASNSSALHWLYASRPTLHGV